MDASQIRKLVDELIQNLEGDWVLIGGALLHYLGLTDRQTLDIDLAPIGRIDNSITLKAIELASQHSLPPETINFAAEYFLKKQKGWEKDLVLLKKGKRGNFYRPNKKLFRKLKEARGTETDLMDIEVYEAGMEE